MSSIILNSSSTQRPQIRTSKGQRAVFGTQLKVVFCPHPHSSRSLLDSDTVVKINRCASERVCRLWEAKVRLGHVETCLQGDGDEEFRKLDMKNETFKRKWHQIIDLWYILTDLSRKNNTSTDFPPLIKEILKRELQVIRLNQKWCELTQKWTRRDSDSRVRRRDLCTGVEHGRQRIYSFSDIH